jgi:hypothetical protein
MYDRLSGEGAARLWTVIGGVGSAAAVLITVLSLVIGSSGSPSDAPRPEAPPPANPTSTSDPASAPPSTLEPSPRQAAAPDLTVYLADRVRPCGIAGSIQKTGPAYINGTLYSHSIHQTPNGYTETAFYVGRQARSFMATVGPIDNGPFPQHQMQFELIADAGQSLFTSGALVAGETEPVEVSIEGVLNLVLIARTVGENYGGQGTAGWGDARVTAGNQILCP